MLIGLAGRMSSGKDTAGAYLVARYGFRRYALADKVKQLCAFVIPREEIGWTGTDWTGPKSVEGRRLLQGIGQGARDVLGIDVWIDALATSWFYDTPTNAVVTDIRNQNEAEFIRENGGAVWRIARPSIQRGGQADDHETERGVDELVADVELVNDGTLRDLYARVDALMEGNR